MARRWDHGVMPSALRRPGWATAAVLAGALLTGCGSPGSPTLAPTAAPAATSSAGAAEPPARQPASAARAAVRRATAVTAPLPVRSGAGKRAVYSVPQQRVWLVDGTGRVVRSYRVSGQLSQPDAGTYAVYSRSRWATSGVSDERMQYMVRFTYGKRTGTPVGFHDIPQRRDGRFSQSEAQLGRPLSHGCVRQARRDAQALWAFAPVGTRVVVVR